MAPIKLQEYSLFPQQSIWLVKFHHPPFLHYHNFVVVHDGVQSMRYRDHGALLEFVADGFLDETVRLVIHVGRGFIQDHDFALLQQSASQAQQLPFTDTEVCSAFQDFFIQLFWTALSLWLSNLLPPGLPKSHYPDFSQTDPSSCGVVPVNRIGS